MKIKLYKKAPKCPKCKVPMKPEGAAYSDKIQKMIDCKHSWKKGKAERGGNESFGRRKDKCKKCGETRLFQIRYRTYDDIEMEPTEEELTFFYMMTAELHRCPKCLDIYKIEGED